MKVELCPTHERRIVELSQKTGKPISRVVDELLDEALASKSFATRSVSTDDAELIEQANAWDALLGKLETLPEVDPKDNLCPSRDHDQILYGGPSPGQRGGFPENRV